MVDASLFGWGTNGYDPSGRLMLVFEGERTNLADLEDPTPPDVAVWDPETDEIVDELDDIVASIWATPSNSHPRSPTARRVPTTSADTPGSTAPRRGPPGGRRDIVGGRHPRLRRGQPR